MLSDFCVSYAEFQSLPVENLLCLDWLLEKKIHKIGS